MHQLLLELITIQTTMYKLVVLSVVLAAACASPNGVWGASLGWAAPWGAGVAAPFASPIFNQLVGPLGPVPSVGARNYRGPLSLAPGQPANILGADGRPLDTYSVNLDKAVHYTAKALEGNGGRLQKRSILAANLADNHLATASLLNAHFAAGPLAAGAWTAGPLAATTLAATPLTQGRSWVGPASLDPVAISVFGPIGPLGFGVDANARFRNY